MKTKWFLSTKQCLGQVIEIFKLCPVAASLIRCRTHKPPRLQLIAANMALANTAAHISDDAWDTATTGWTYRTLETNAYCF